MASNSEREEQEGYPKSIAHEVYELKRKAVTMFHNDHADGDTAIYMLLAELAPLIDKYVEERERVARIDELKQFSGNYGYTDWISDRVSELQTKEISNDR